MFKENDNMRPGPTPERVLAVCRLISQGSYTNQDIYKECALNEDADLNDEAIRSSIDSAEELGFIKKNKDRYELVIDKKYLDTAHVFRRLFLLLRSRIKRLPFSSLQNGL